MAESQGEANGALDASCTGAWRQSAGPLLNRTRGARQGRVGGSGRKPVTRIPEPGRVDEYHTRVPAHGAIELFIGPDGDITTERPHVQVVHDPALGGAVVTATDAAGAQIHQERLPASASGNDIQAVVDRLRRMLR